MVRRHLLRWALAVCLALVGMLLTADPALAAGHVVRTGPSLDLGSWPTILAGLCGIGSAQLTALLTHRRAPQWMKSGVHLALSALAGVLINVAVVPGNKWTDYLGEIGVAWIIGIATKFAGATALAEEVTAGAGVGADVAPLVPVTGVAARSNTESTSGT